MLTAALLSLIIAADPTAAADPTGGPPLPDMDARSAAEVHRASVEDYGFVSLFDGETLDGWVVPEGDNGHWRVVDGVIDYDALSESPADDKSLKTAASYQDFILELEWRVSQHPPVGPVPLVMPDGTDLKDAAGEKITVYRPNHDSGVILRGSPMAQVNIWGWPVGSGEDYMFRSPGSAPPEQKAAFTPRMNADRPLGEWNRFTIVVVGRQVTVLLNDQTVIDRAVMPDTVPEDGPIMLQHHGGSDGEGGVVPMSATVQFRNMRIKELPTE